MAIPYYKKDGSGACLDPRKHNVDKYIKDMDIRNKQLKASQDNKFKNDVESITKDHLCIILPNSGKAGYSAAYAKGWDGMTKNEIGK